MDSICHHMRIKPTNVLAFMYDSSASNLLSFVDKLEHVFVFSDDNTCMPHTDNHVGEAFNTPLLDEFMALYNTVISKTNSASLRIFAEVVVQCLDRGERGGMVEGVGVWYLYEIAQAYI